jgi:hypothetical protein
MLTGQTCSRQWSNQCLTCGNFWVNGGAMWPSHGLPRGTPYWFIFGGKVCLRVVGVEPVTSMGEKSW